MARQKPATFERARELATAFRMSSERLSINYGFGPGSYVRGELGAMRELAAAMLRDCATRPQSGEAGVAHRIDGVTQWFAGEFVEAREHLEQALAIFDPERDRDLAFRFGQDVGVSAMAYSAYRALAARRGRSPRERDRRMTARRREQRPRRRPPPMDFPRRDVRADCAEISTAPPRSPSRSSQLAKEHELTLWIAPARFLDGWVEWRSGEPRRRPLRNAPGSGLSGRSRARSGPLRSAETILAEAEAEAGEIDAALATIDRAIAESERTGQRWFDAELHRIRGEILLKQNPADPAPAEEAFLAAIAIAQAQKARSFELRAALSLAKLYQSTGRPADAHDVLGPALEGFAPTPEFPEIAEAFELLAAVKSAAQL